MRVMHFSVRKNHDISDVSIPAIYAGLSVSFIIAGVVFVLLFALIVIMAVFSIASATVAVFMIIGFNPYMLIPQMPYWCGALLAFSLIALSVLSAVGCKYFARFLFQFKRAFCRHCYNQNASIHGKALLQPIKPFPELTAKTGLKLEKIARVSLAVFTVYFVSGFVVNCISAGALGFWHQWNWFVK